MNDYMGLWSVEQKKINNEYDYYCFDLVINFYIFSSLFFHNPNVCGFLEGTCRWGEFGEGGMLWGECNARQFEWFDGNAVNELLYKVRWRLSFLQIQYVPS